MARIPVALVLTMYTLFVAGRYDPASFTSGMFSALYVQLVGQTWKYQPKWLVRCECARACVCLYAACVRACVRACAGGILVSILLCIRVGMQKARLFACTLCLRALCACKCFQLNAHKNVAI